MSGMRKLLCLLVGAVLAAVALPAGAGGNTQTKYFSASFPLLIGGGTQTIQVTFYNATPPPGVSTINSISITTPKAAIDIIPASSSPGTWTSLGTDMNTGGHIWEVTNFPGIKNGKSGVFTVVINDQDTGDQCISGAWQATANTGNSLNGDTFNDNGNSQLVSSCDGGLACDTTVSALDVDLSPGQHLGLQRGPYDADGSSCMELQVPYLADFVSSGAQSFSFLELSGNQHPTIEYLLSWNAVDITGWPAFQPQVAWLNTDGTPASQPGTPAFIPAQVCLSDNLSDPMHIMPVMPVTGSPYNANGTTTKAKMCIAEQGWAVVNGQIKYWDRVIDQGDGHVAGP